ncbi:MAG: asparaginase, partial [Candidatus Puniceispirillaceae bacterium]
MRPHREIIIDGTMWLEGGSPNSDSLGSHLECSFCGYRLRKRRSKPVINLPFVSSEPLSVLVNRNGFCESSHQVDVAVCGADGEVVLGLGNVESVIFPRS